MKMQSCTEDEFKIIMRCAEGVQTGKDVGKTHRTLVWERYSIWKGWQEVGVEYHNSEGSSYEVPAFLYKAYIK